MSIFSDRKKDEIRNRHGYHAATPASARSHDAVREAAITLAEVLNDSVPPCRELDQAQERLHEVRMWANMGIAVHGAPLAFGDEKTTPQPSHGQGQTKVSST